MRTATIASLFCLSWVAVATIALAQPATHDRPETHADTAKDAAKSDSGKPDDAKSRDEKSKEDKKAEKLKPSITHSSVLIDGKPIKYTATAGLTELPDYDGKPKANIFSVSYVAERDASDAASRPLVFAFNGGPGSSSVWLHLGALGPKRVKLADPNETAHQPSLARPPFSLVENEYTWLDLADIVFVDPVSTGYSRAVEGENPHQFHGLDEDIRAMADFIRLWITKNQRWQSPIYLAGESYGTTRAAGLSSYLQGADGIFLSGIVLVSPVLNFQTIEFDTGNDTPYWLFVSGYSATAWYHQRLDPALEQRPVADVVREVEQWARTEYMQALALGDALTPEDRARVVASLSRYTGLSKDYVQRSNLRIEMEHFAKELMRDKSRTIGRFDSRYTGIDRNGIGATPDFDPSYAAVQGAFTAGLNAYVRQDLKYENDAPYEILTGRVHPWSFNSATNRYADVAESLRSAMMQNTSLRVLVCSGYYDLATPAAAATYTIDHLGLDPTTRGNISQAFYEAGHMMYVRHADLVKLKKDAAAFIGTGLKIDGK
jgi:carboxypeptidase C (cathepsin A)